MTTDTKWIIGTGGAITTAIVGTGAVLAGLLLTQIAGVNAHSDDVNTRMNRIEIRLDGFDERLRERST